MGTISDIRMILQSNAFFLYLELKEPLTLLELRALLFYSRRRPTFPHSYPCSIIGPEGLNFRVRDGNGCDPLGIATEKLLGCRVQGPGSSKVKSFRS